MRLGICCGIGSFAGIKDMALADLPRVLNVMKAAGADFAEFSVGTVMVDDYDAVRRIVEASPLRPEAFNSFIPGRLPITGPAPKTAEAFEYAATALRRIAEVGGDVCVFGSGAARKAPENFPLEEARAQFVAFCKQVAPVAAEHNVTVAIEPLNRFEDNICISVQDGFMLCERIAHPRVQLLADLTHVAVGEEPLANVSAAGPRLVHTHVSDIGPVPGRTRAAPGGNPGGEVDYVGFFRALKACGYAGRCSYEGPLSDDARECGPLIQFLRGRLAQV